MARERSIARGRTRNTFYTSLFNISLVMFILSLFAGISVYSYIELELAQEEIQLMLEIPDRVSDEDIDLFEEYLLDQPWVKDLEFTSKEEAGEIFIGEVGEEFMDLMDGVNPLPASFDLGLEYSFINTDSLENIHQQLAEQKILVVQDIIYPIGEIEQLRENTSKRIKLAAGIGLIVALVAFFIVNGTIRLAIYGKRLMIRSMQLIGATNGFIRRPFIRMGILQGLFGAIIACIVLISILFFIQKFQFDFYTRPEAINQLMLRYEFMVLLAGIIIFGAVLGWFSSLWAVNRFLNKNLDQLV